MQTPKPLVIQTYETFSAISILLLDLAESLEDNSGNGDGDSSDE